MQEAGMKWCRGCRQLKPLEDDFHIARRSKDGRQSQCKVCLNTANRAVINHKKKLIYEYLLKHPCVDCGETDPVVLDFDHLEPTSKMESVSVLRRSSSHLTEIRAEIEKCAVRCANCHRRRTAKANNWYAFLKDDPPPLGRRLRRDLRTL